MPVPVPLAASGLCVPDYQCQWTTYTAVNSGTPQASWQPWSFDLSTLCSASGGYNTTDSQGHTYQFNICGDSSFNCIPSWAEPWSRASGVAVQVIGTTPTCNTSAPACTDPAGNPVCCSAPCEVLGYGGPFWQLQDPTNPMSGGLIIQHYGVLPTNSDLYKCPYNTRTGTMEERTVTFSIACDPTQAPGQLMVINATYNATNICTNTVYLAASEACGCSPDCANKTCGPDGCGGFCGGLDGLCPKLASNSSTAAVCLPSQVCCTPSCVGRMCGSDGCGGTCGACSDSEYCNLFQKCAPRQ